MVYSMYYFKCCMLSVSAVYVIIFFLTMVTWDICIQHTIKRAKLVKEMEQGQSESISVSLLLSVSVSSSDSLSVSFVGARKKSRKFCNSSLSSVSKWTASGRVVFSIPQVDERFKQCRHSHPSEQLCPLLRHPHLPVVHPVLHLHPLVSKSTLSFIAARFSSLSQSMERMPSVTFQPQLVTSAISISFLSACLHMSRTQHERFQCRHRASLEGIISVS